MERTDPVIVNDDQFAGFDFPDKFGANHIKGNAFRCKYPGIAELTHDQRPDPHRIPASNHSFRRDADKRIGTLKLFERIDEAVEQRLEGRCRDQMDNRLGVGSGLKDRAVTHQLMAQRYCIGYIAIVRNGETAGREFGVEWLYITQSAFARC